LETSELRLGRSVNWIVYLLVLVASAPQFTLAADVNNFAPLSEINTENVARLALVFSFRTGQAGGQSGAPVVVNDLLLLQTAFPHTLYALDIHQQAAPVRWSFTPLSDRRAAGLTCCDATVGGPVAADGQVVLNTLDGHTIALDAATGQVLWDVMAATLSSGETLSTSPLIAGDRIIIGSAGDDFGARGWVAGLDPHTGATVWKRFNTGPEDDVGIGAGFNPPYPRDQRHDGGVAASPATSPMTAITGFCCTARVIRHRGTRIRGRATTNGRPACLPAMRRPVMRGGFSRLVRTIFTPWVPPVPCCQPTCNGRARTAICSSTRTPTARSTCWTAVPVRSCPQRLLSR
jgi:hypothetical protein